MVIKCQKKIWGELKLLSADKFGTMQVQSKREEDERIHLEWGKNLFG